MRFELGAGRILPRWVVAFFLGGAVVLIPWIVLMFTVPQVVNVPKHWELVWGGFDCFLVLGFGVTAYRLITRSPRGAVTAAMTGTMLLVDAWFDVLTTHRGGQVVSVLMAVFAEIPCAVICFYVSRRIVSLFEQAKDYLGAAGFKVRNGVLVPPAGFPNPHAPEAADALTTTAPHTPHTSYVPAEPGESGPEAPRREPAGAAGPEPHTLEPHALEPAVLEPHTLEPAALETAVLETAVVETAAVEPHASERGLGAPVGKQGLLAEPL